MYAEYMRPKLTFLALDPCFNLYIYITYPAKPKQYTHIVFGRVSKDFLISRATSGSFSWHKNEFEKKTFEDPWRRKIYLLLMKILFSAQIYLCILTVCDLYRMRTGGGVNGFWCILVLSLIPLSGENSRLYSLKRRILPNIMHIA